MKLDLRAVITKKEINEMKRKVHIGDQMKLSTLKASSGGGATAVQRRGKVVGKYPFGVVIELKHNVRDSLTWVDLVQRERKLYAVQNGGT